jgi:hypothetical protein
MKIYFTASTAEFNKFKEVYHQIRNLIIEDGHILTRDWIPKAEKRIDAKEKELYDIKEIYKATIQGISEAELVIIEDTISNFSTGHQITISLMRQKPTLVLWSGEKHKHFNQMYIHGIDSEYLEIVRYDKDNLVLILKSFINKYKNFQQKDRFNLVLNGAQRDYLDWKHYTTGLSRTKMIKELIDREIGDDNDYSVYISK